MGSSESTLVKMPHCWKSHVTAQVCSTGIHTFAPRQTGNKPTIGCH